MELQRNLYKIILIGDSNVGKSNICTRIAKDQYRAEMKSTIGLDTYLVQRNVYGKDIEILLWDTAGQERFRGLTQQYFRGAHGVIVVYDITYTQSFESVKRWVQDVRHNTDSNVKMVLVGNKSDLENLRQVTMLAAQRLAQQQGMAFIETSAKTAENIEEALQLLVAAIYDEKSCNGSIDSSMASHLSQFTVEIKKGEELLPNRGTSKTSCCAQ